MATFAKRGARLTALTLVPAAFAVAMTGGSAQALPVQIPDVFGGTAKAAAIHIEVNLPIPGVPSIVQDISLTDGNALKSLNGALESVGKSTLGNGTLINKEVLASLTTVLEKSDAILPTQQLLGLVTLGLGNIKSTVAPEATSSVLTSSSSSQLATLRIGMGALTSALPLLKEDLLSSVTDQVTPVVDTVLGLLNSTPVTPVLQPVLDQVNPLVDNLTSLIGNLSADDALLGLNLIESSNTITRKGEAMTSEAFASLGGKDTPALTVLGGLVTIDAIKTRSFSTAGGSKGSAAADTTTDILNIKVGDILNLALGSNGLTGSIGGNTLPLGALNDAFQQVIGTVNGLLDVAGVKILTGQKVVNVDPNGKFASSSSEGLGIIVNPLKALKPLVGIQLVPAGTAVNAARVAKPVPVVKPPARPLPRTGAELPLFAVLGTGLAGMALVARRRRLAEI